MLPANSFGAQNVMPVAIQYFYTAVNLPLRTILQMTCPLHIRPLKSMLMPKINIGFSSVYLYFEKFSDYKGLDFFLFLEKQTNALYYGIGLFYSTITLTSFITQKIRPYYILGIKVCLCSYNKKHFFTARPIEKSTF